jgi:hypothetical protein
MLDPTADEDAIEARTKQLCGGRVFVDVVPEESKLETDPDTGLVLPYIILTFGSIFPKATDRSIAGEDQQPHILPMVFECWATTGRAARRTANALLPLFVGWEPSDNASELYLAGGRSFESRDNAGRPTRAMQSVTAQIEFNQMVLDTA